MYGIKKIYLKTKKYKKTLSKILSRKLNNMASRGLDSTSFAIYKYKNNIVELS